MFGKVMSIVGGVGLGAGLLYLLDPDSGNKRRRQIHPRRPRHARVHVQGNEQNTPRPNHTPIKTRYVLIHYAFTCQ